MPNSGAHIIVFGNEKGGSGKSTAAMHTAIGLLRLGYRVATIDLDARQGTLTRYLSNRFSYISRQRTELPSPAHVPIENINAKTLAQKQAQERDFLDMALNDLQPGHDFIVIDTPGTDSHLSRLAHYRADSLVTPLNDSFIDLDMLARIDVMSHEIESASTYARLVSHVRKERHEKPLRWLVMRNRLSHIKARNKELIGTLLKKLSEDLVFDLVGGFGERVIYKELFLDGLTLLDLKESRNKSLSLSEITARQEVRQLIRQIGPDKIKGYKKPL